MIVTESVVVEMVILLGVVMGFISASSDIERGKFRLAEGEFCWESLDLLGDSVFFWVLIENLRESPLIFGSRGLSRVEEARGPWLRRSVLITLK